MLQEVSLDSDIEGVTVEIFKDSEQIETVLEPKKPNITVNIEYRSLIAYYIMKAVFSVAKTVGDFLKREYYEDEEIYDDSPSGSYPTDQSIFEGGTKLTHAEKMGYVNYTPFTDYSGYNADIWSRKILGFRDDMYQCKEISLDIKFPYEKLIMLGDKPLRLNMMKLIKTNKNWFPMINEDGNSECLFNSVTITLNRLICNSPVSLTLRMFGGENKIDSLKVQTLFDDIDDSENDEPPESTLPPPSFELTNNTVGKFLYCHAAESFKFFPGLLWNTCAPAKLEDLAKYIKVIERDGEKYVRMEKNNETIAVVSYLSRSHNGVMDIENGDKFFFKMSIDTWKKIRTTFENLTAITDFNGMELSMAPTFYTSWGEAFQASEVKSVINAYNFSDPTSVSCDKPQNKKTNEETKQEFERNKIENGFHVDMKLMVYYRLNKTI